jgi:4a-hydroxytetrahydrobiopterin dehydratase
MALREKTCTACQKATIALKGASLSELKKQIDSSWQIVDDHHLQKTFPFKNFMAGLRFVNHIAEVAEKEGHHPDLELKYTAVTVKLYTHKVGGLTETDFILADKIDAILEQMRGT